MCSDAALEPQEKHEALETEVKEDRFSALLSPRNFMIHKKNVTSMKCYLNITSNYVTSKIITINQNNVSASLAWTRLILGQVDISPRNQCQLSASGKIDHAQQWTAVLNFSIYL